MNGLTTAGPVTRTLMGAMRAAARQGNNVVRLELVNGNGLTFNIREVLDDGLLGQRADNQNIAMVPFGAIAMMEFGS